jgi:hypothetical protein
MNLDKIALRVAAIEPNNPQESAEFGESAGTAIEEGSGIPEVAARIKNSLLGEEIIENEKEFDGGYWTGRWSLHPDVKNTGLSWEVEEVKTTSKTWAPDLAVLKAELSKLGIGFEH